MGARWIVGTTAAVSLAVVGALQLPLDTPFASSVFGPLDMSSRPGAQFLGQSTREITASTPTPPPGPLTTSPVAAEDHLPPSLSLTVTPPTVVIGATTELSGRVIEDGTPAAGRTVTVEQRPVGTGTWTTVPGVQSLTTSFEGTFLLTGVEPGSSTDYRARLAEGPAESLVQRVNVRARVENTTATNPLSLGERRVVTGSVVPAHDGSVQVTVLRNGTRVAREAVSLIDSRFRWSYRPKRVGGYTVVVTWAGDADHLGTMSTRKSFRVRKG